MSDTPIKQQARAFNCEAFYDLCQNYRHMPIGNQEAVRSSYKALQNYCTQALHAQRKQVWEEAAKEAANCAVVSELGRIRDGYNYFALWCREQAQGEASDALDT